MTHRASYELVGARKETNAQVVGLHHHVVGHEVRPRWINTKSKSAHVLKDRTDKEGIQSGDQKKADERQRISDGVHLDAD